GKKITGMGGAMDLVNGAKELIVMMTHFDKKKRCKLMKKCTFPLTGVEVVNRIVTDMGVFVPDGKKFIVKKLASGVKEDELKMKELI
ncbi:MAG: succinyl-CoA--3-ketoacid-CoA transferase, partial [Halobacteriovoraceae bacterium]|nr:succinyl-CoA--3-ketoacid-CoA transferase [Halobacteriovoraceae bacterium]